MATRTKTNAAKYRFSVAQMVELFGPLNKNEQSIRNLIRRRDLKPVATLKSGIKQWDLREVVAALEPRGGKVEMDEAKLEGQILSNEAKRLELERTKEEIRAEQRTADVAEFRGALGALRRALASVKAPEVAAALDAAQAEAESWEQ